MLSTREVLGKVISGERHIHSQGFPISSAFVLTQLKNRLVFNFNRQIKLFGQVPVKMETLERFGANLIKDDVLMSLDIKKGYHHFRLHPKIRNWFIFHVAGRFFRCIALLFGWCLSPMYFIKLMRPFVQCLRQRHEYQVNTYVDDFAVAPTNESRPATPADVLQAQDVTGRLLTRCGLQRKEDKGDWHG